MRHCQDCGEIRTDVALCQQCGLNVCRWCRADTLCIACDARQTQLQKEEVPA